LTPDPQDPDAAELLGCVDEMHCSGCDGLGVVIDAAPLGAALWLIAWRTEHAAGCPGGREPVLAYAVDADWLARGDFDLPGPPGDRP
jgi:hypothetical protein